MFVPPWMVKAFGSCGRSLRNHRKCMFSLVRLVFRIQGKWFLISCHELKSIAVRYVVFPSKCSCLLWCDTHPDSFIWAYVRDQSQFLRKRRQLAIFNVELEHMVGQVVFPELWRLVVSPLDKSRTLLYRYHRLLITEALRLLELTRIGHDWWH